MRSRALGVLILAAQALLWALAAPMAVAQDKPAATPGFAPRQVIAAVPRDWPPQYSLDSAGNPAGFAIDVMNAIAARAGVRVTFRVVDSFASVEELMEAGKADIIPNSGITPERAAQYGFTAPVQVIAISIIVRPMTTGIGGMADLVGHPVGIVRTSVGEKIIAPYVSIRTVMFGDIESALFGLLTGEVDAIIYARSVVTALARKAGVEDRIESVEPPLLEIKRAIRVRKDRPDLLAVLDRAVSDFVDTQEYRRIYAKWYGNPAPFWAGRRLAWAAGAAPVALLILVVLWRYRLMVRMNRRIAASEGKFRDLIEGAVPGVLIHRDHQPLFVNQSYARIYGYDSPDEMLRQRSALEHIARHEHARLEGYAAARMRGDEAPAVYEYQGVRKDGTLIWLENRARVVDWEGAPAIQSTVVDVTEKRQADTELMLRSSQQAVVAELGQLALLNDDLDAYLNMTVRLAASFMESDLCGVLELTPDGKEFLLRAGVGWKPGLVGHAKISAGPQLQAGFALSTKEAVVVADWRAETRFKGSPMLSDHGVRCGVTVVIGDPEKPIGVLGVHRKEPRAYSEDDVLFLKTVAVMLASAISRDDANVALRASDDRLRGAIESLQEGFALFDADDRLVMVNDVYRRINPNAQALMDKGATFEDVIRANVANGMLADAVGREDDFIRERLAQHRDPKVPIIRRHSNGKWYIIKETRTPEGGIAITFTDVTELKRTEDALRESREQFRAVAQSVNDAIIAIDGENRVVQWNNGAQNIFGYEESEILGQPLTRLIPARYRADHGAAVKRVKQTGKSRLVGKTLELAGLRKDGSEFPAEISIGNWNSGGKTYFSGVVRNITERKRAEEALRRSEALFRAVVDYSPTKIHIKDTDGRYTLINKEAEKLFGVTDAEGRGKTSHDLFPKAQADFFVARDRAVIESRRPIEQEEKFTVNGEEHTYLTVKFPILDGDRVVAVGGIGTDISKRKQEENKLAELQTALAHVSRVSAMGEMAAGLAHELNQPLTAITNYAKGTLRRLHAGGDSVDLLPIMELVAEQALRAGEIIRKIRGFMNRVAPQKAPVDLRKAIDEVMALLAGEVHMSGIEVGIDLPKTLPAVSADIIQIQQVLLNLIRNAVAAMDNGDSDIHRLEIGAKATGAGAVEVYVRDNGPGIPPDIEEQLFEPFFTTKTDGLGMGLSISRSIIVGHQGRIWVNSDRGKGTSFHFTLPTSGSVEHDAA